MISIIFHKDFKEFFEEQCRFSIIRGSFLIISSVKIINQSKLLKKYYEPDS